MYIVTKNNPFYPDVKYFQSLDEANAQVDEWLIEMESINGDDGKHECKVTVAEVIETWTVRSDY